MGRIASGAAFWLGRRSARELEAACLHPREAQAEALRKILGRNARTAFARDHALTGRETPEEFRRKVPIRDFEGLRPYVDRAALGEPGVLTEADPIYFARTSGTTASPKLIPATAESAASEARLMRQWVHRARLAHPAFLSGDIFTVVSPEVEEHAGSGVPIGSASGFVAGRIPALVRRSFAVPGALAAVPEYAARYMAMLRMGLERSITHLSTPNPSTLLRIAELGAAHAEEILRAIHDGRLLPGAPRRTPETEGLRSVEAGLRPNPSRAAELEKLAARRGRLAPRDAWPDLALIACWTGGAVGGTAARLGEWYGEAPVRDLGYVASEGRFTIPIADGTPAGLPVLEDKFFEFLPEDDGDGPALGIEDLRMGAQYRMVVTTSAGLFRYDIQDVIQVDGFHGRTPMLAFARKGRDMANITGEKLHANQVIAAMAAMAAMTASPGGKVRQFRVAADAPQARYRFYLEPENDPGHEAWGSEWLRTLDSRLKDQNLEYRQKRESGRLRPPCLHVMAKGWSESLFRSWIRSGRKDAQYKWQVLLPGPDADYAEDIVSTVETGETGP